MFICKPRRLKKPYEDFLLHGVADLSGNFYETPSHFYSNDGKRRLEKYLPKAKNPQQNDAFGDIDNGRRKTMQSSDLWFRRMWMKKWGVW